MLRGAQVICPNCQTGFLVPAHAAETLCPSCDDHIVWRQCRSTGEAFPVLSRWNTWTHPDCSLVHSVDLTHRVALPTRASARPESPDALITPEHAADPGNSDEVFEVLAEDAAWIERGLQGRLYRDRDHLGIAPPAEDDAESAMIARLDHITEFQVRFGEDVGKHRRLFRRAAKHAVPSTQLVLWTSETAVVLDVVADPEQLRNALLSALPGGRWRDAGACAPLDAQADSVQDDVQPGVEGGAGRQVR